ncbi:MAG TPA: ABC transporter ATP-binding protein [Chthonomonadales bacterium]|nr:ABC transporter ATP-binding protein [Chthonomonadales bacterium]
MRTLWRALRYLAPYWPLQVAALLCALVVTATSFVWPYVSKQLIDHVFWPEAGSPEQRLASLRAVMAVIAGAAVGGIVFGVVRSYLFARVGERAAADMRRDLFRHLHNLPQKYFDRRATGNTMSVVQNDVEALQVLYTSTLVDFTTNILTATVAVGLLVWQSPNLAAIAIPIPILFAVVLVMFGRPLHRGGRRVRDETGRVQEVLQESISGVREVKAFARAPRECARYMDRVWALARARVGMAMLGAGNGAASQVVIIGGIGLIVFLGAGNVIRGEMSAGELVMFLDVMRMLFGPAASFVALFTQVAGALGAADRAFELADAPAEADAPAGAAVLTPPRGDVRFDGVRFRYDEDGQDVLTGIDLTVEAGEKVALVGPSGSGKTTLVSLLARLYEPTEGAVLLDGRDVRSFRLRDLRGWMAYVPQEPFLFAATVRENIAFGREGAEPDAIEAAAAVANAKGFIEALPEGYETVLGERGARLSVGQKQRIAIARAILRDPRVLVLDEATSAQDSESEALVQEAVGRLVQGRTCFIIAHRLATVQTADRIVVMESGRIVECGRHSDLVAGGGLYARLHALQSLNGAPVPEAFADA